MAGFGERSKIPNLIQKLECEIPQVGHPQAVTNCYPQLNLICKTEHTHTHK